MARKRGQQPGQQPRTLNTAMTEQAAASRRNRQLRQWNARLRDVLTRLMPKSGNAWIYVVGLIAAAWLWDSNHPPRPHDTFGSATFNPYAAVADGEIIRLDETDAQNSRFVTVSKRRRQMVYVVYTASDTVAHQATGFMTISKFGPPTRVSGPVKIEVIQGPSIICLGNNHYAFIDSPVVEHIGPLRLFRRPTNTLRPALVADDGLYRGLYRTDCAVPPPETIIALGASFGVYLSVRAPGQQ